MSKLLATLFSCLARKLLPPITSTASLILLSPFMCSIKSICPSLCNELHCIQYYCRPFSGIPPPSRNEAKQKSFSRRATYIQYFRLLKERIPQLSCTVCVGRGKQAITVPPWRSTRDDTIPDGNYAAVVLFIAFVSFHQHLGGVSVSFARLQGFLFLVEN